MHEARAELHHVTRACACASRITSNKRVGARGRKRGALLVLHAVAVVAHDDIVEGPAMAQQTKICVS
jgi:hypothetical protein